MTCHDYELNMITVPCKLTQKAVILSCIILQGTTNALMFNEPLELSKSNPEWDAIRGRFVRTHLLHFFNIFIVHVESFNFMYDYQRVDDHDILRVKFHHQLWHTAPLWQLIFYHNNESIILLLFIWKYLQTQAWTQVIVPWGVVRSTTLEYYCNPQSTLP